MIPPTTVEEVYLAVGETKPEYEKVDYYGNLIFWSAPVSTFGKSRWAKVVSTSVYDRITIRNANTVKKIAEMIRREMK